MKNTSERRGSAILIVLIFSVVIALLVTSATSYSVTESRLNYRQTLYLQSRYLAEALVEHGFAQIQQRYGERTQFPILGMVTEPLALPANAFFEIPTNRVVTGTTGRPTGRIDTVSSVNPYLMGGTIPPGSWQTIQNIPLNEGDPLMNQRVWLREIRVMARATVQPTRTGGQPITSYTTQVLQVRDAPLFANAIFYNMDMEIAPGATMNIEGPVHSNRNIYTGGGGGQLSYNGGLTSAAEIFYGRLPGWSGRGSGNTLATVRVVDRNPDDPANPYVNWPSDLNLSSNAPNLSADWRTISTNLWNGGVQSASHDMLPLNLVAMRPYEPEVGVTPAVNDAHDIIEPPAALPVTTDPEYSTLREIENQKFSNKAGLRIVHNYSISGTTGLAIHTVTGYKPRRTSGVVERDANGNILWDQVELPPDLLLTTATPTMRDRRRNSTWSDTDTNRDLYLLDLDVSVLKDAVAAAAGTPSSRLFPAGTGPVATFDPSSDWNGVVYVESQNLSRSGVRVINGTQIPSRGSDEGMTLATNNALYVRGSFNSDNNASTGSQTQPDYRYPTVVTGGTEKPAALAADAITILSSAWDSAADALSLTLPTSGSVPAAGADATAGFTEISAAFLTGIAPSTASYYSGGVENLPRLLESWSGRTLRYRGSMVVLFQSEVATERWRDTGNYYNAPTRNWGFNVTFSEGAYPPATPMSRNFRRSFFRDISLADFTTTWNTMRAELAAAGAASSDLDALAPD